MMAASVLMSGNALATEQGISNFLNGLEQFSMAYVPPPGVYYMVHAFQYNANDVRDNDGNRVELPLSMKIDGLAPRVAWSTRKKLFDGRLIFQGVLPLLRVSGSDVSVGPTGQMVPRSGTTSGIGDLELGMALGYSRSDAILPLRPLKG